MIHVERVAAPLILAVKDRPEVESALVRRACQGDLSAFETLYRSHDGRVHALCLRMSGNPVRAAEFTQKAFVTAWEKLALFRGDSPFGSWLHRVAVNTVLADLRAELRRTRRRMGRGTGLGDLRLRVTAWVKTA